MGIYKLITGLRFYGKYVIIYAAGVDLKQVS